MLDGLLQVFDQAELVPLLLERCDDPWEGFPGIRDPIVHEDHRLVVLEGGRNDVVEDGAGVDRPVGGVFGAVFACILFLFYRKQERFVQVLEDN